MTSETDFLRSIREAPDDDDLRLDTLDLGCDRLNDEDVEELARCPHLGRLSALLLYNNEIGERGLRALCHSEHLAGLRDLNLAGNRINSGATPWLALYSFPRL